MGKLALLVIHKVLNPSIIVSGGFGVSGVEGKILAICFARKKDILFLRLCYGMQLAVVEFARNFYGLRANSFEIDSDAEHKVIDVLPEQRYIFDKGGTMRLGAYQCGIKERIKSMEDL